jgi:hypothetical protein
VRPTLAGSEFVRAAHALGGERRRFSIHVTSLDSHGDDLDEASHTMVLCYVTEKSALRVNTMSEIAFREELVIARATNAKGQGVTSGCKILVMAPDSSAATGWNAFPAVAAEA